METQLSCFLEHFFVCTKLYQTHSVFLCIFPEFVCVVTCDGRTIVGELAGHDQVQNLILKDSYERLYSLEESVERVPLGLYVIRGDNVALVSEFLEEKWNDAIKAEPLRPITQQNY